MKKSLPLIVIIAASATFAVVKSGPDKEENHQAMTQSIPLSSSSSETQPKIESEQHTIKNQTAPIPARTDSELYNSIRHIEVGQSFSIEMTDSGGAMLIEVKSKTYDDVLNVHSIAGLVVGMPASSYAQISVDDNGFIGSLNTTTDTYYIVGSRFDYQVINERGHSEGLAHDIAEQHSDSQTPTDPETAQVIQQLLKD